MSQEIPKSEQLQMAIGKINDEITQIATRAQKSDSFNYEGEIEAKTKNTSSRVNIDTPPEVFWKNLIEEHIARTVLLLGRSDYLNSPEAILINICQRNAVDLISSRLNGSSQPLTELERASLNSCLLAFCSFSWAKNPELFTELNTNLKKLANLYAGHR